jgi:hypothetical protein
MGVLDDTELESEHGERFLASERRRERPDKGLFRVRGCCGNDSRAQSLGAPCRTSGTLVELIRCEVRNAADYDILY